MRCPAQKERTPLVKQLSPCGMYGGTMSKNRRADMGHGTSTRNYVRGAKFHVKLRRCQRVYSKTAATEIKIKIRKKKKTYVFGNSSKKTTRKYHVTGSMMYPFTETPL